ncbi:MAG: indole-3-glycerol-phosphate synthase [Saprospiraceae bacterium]
MSVIDSINAQRRKDVQLQAQAVTIEQLKTSPLYHRTCSSLRKALLNSGPVAVIAEHKRASPSEGQYGCPSDLEAVVRGYQKAGVAAISILTEPHRFGGSLAHLTQARALTNLPLLRKDFIVTPYQLHEAKSAGADAVLLIAAGLTLPEANDLAVLARDLGLDVLLELHDATELDYLTINPDVVGINNRNLKTLKIDLQSSIDLFDQLPTDLVKISESGIQNPVDAERLLTRGYQGLLVGTQFMKTSDPGEACHAFIEASTRLLESQKPAL